MDDVTDFFDIFFKQAQGVGVGDHDTGGVFIHQLFHCFGIDDAVGTGFYVDRLVAAQGGGGRVGAVGRIRNQDLGSLFPLFCVVGIDHQDAGKFTVGTGCGLQGDCRETCDFTQKMFQFVHEAECPLGELVSGEGMGTGKSLAGCLNLVGFGVVLHGAGAQGIHPGVHAEVPLGKPCEMTHHVQLGKLGKFRGVTGEGRVHFNPFHV